MKTGIAQSIALVFLVVPPITLQGQTDWPANGNDPGATKYSALTQINTKNVGKLQKVWTWEPGETQSGYETTPLVIDNRMYISTPRQRVAALDPETGKQLWEFDPKPKRQGTHRGVSYWPGDEQTKPRIFFSTGDSRLVAVDAATGKAANAFGDNGEIDLRVGVADKFPDASYYSSSPPAVYHNLLIMGPRTAEGTPDAKGPAGDIRAFERAQR